MMVRLFTFLIALLFYVKFSYLNISSAYTAQLYNY
jgi:hypothetical protein